MSQTKNEIKHHEAGDRTEPWHGVYVINMPSYDYLSGRDQKGLVGSFNQFERRSIIFGQNGFQVKEAGKTMASGRYKKVFNKPELQHELQLDYIEGLKYMFDYYKTTLINDNIISLKDDKNNVPFLRQE